MSHDGCDERWIKTIELYLRDQLSDAQAQLELKQDQVDDLREEVETLK
jgi:hypothetical protein